MSEPSAHFPNPADDAADDVFTSPQDDLPPGQLGASPLDTASRVRKPKRMRALLLLFAGAATIVLVVIFASKRGVTPTPTTPGSEDPNGLVAAPVTKKPVSADSLPTAAPTPGVSTSAPLDPLDVVNGGHGTTPPATNGSATNPLPGSPPVVYDPTAAGTPGRGARPTTPAPAPDPFGSVLPPATPAGSPQGRGQDAVLPGAPEEAVAPEQRMRLQAQERAAKEAALGEYRKAEEQRLRTNTMVAENGALLRSPTGTAPSRFGTPSTAGAMGGTQAGSATATDGSAADILPGTRVEAVTVSQFIGDEQGAGQVEIRLTAPLRSRGRLILPAGTRGFGNMTGGTPQPGQPVRVSLVVTVFVTPQGEVIRTLSAKGVDARTLATSIPAKAMNRYPQRIARGAMATGVDLALTRGQTQRPSAFEQPSLRDMALNDARRRLGALIGGPIGNETSQTPTVTLPANTVFLLSFGT